MIGEAASNLVKEIRRDIQHSLPHYNGELTARLFTEIGELYSTAQHIMQNEYSSQDPSINALLLFYHLSLKRIRRALLIYHSCRLDFILKNLKSPTVESSLPESKRALMTPNLTAQELDFTSRYKKCLGSFRDHYPSLDLFSGLRLPPRDLFIQVRVLKECGAIQVESGIISLSKDSLHFLKVKDVQFLLSEGYLERIFV